MTTEKSVTDNKNPEMQILTDAATGLLKLATAGATRLAVRILNITLGDVEPETNGSAAPSTAMVVIGKPGRKPGRKAAPAIEIDEKMLAKARKFVAKKESVSAGETATALKASPKVTKAVLDKLTEEKILGPGLPKIGRMVLANAK